MALSLAANLAAVALLVQHLRKVGRGLLRIWSRRLGLLVLALAAGWLLITGWAVAAVILGANAGDPSQNATLLAAGIAESMNCIAAAAIFLLLPTIIVIVVRRRARP